MGCGSLWPYSARNRGVIVMVTAVAVVGAAVIGAVASESSSERAAASAQNASNRIQAAATQAESDVLTNIPQAQEQLLAGARGAADIFRRAVPEQQRQLTAGSLAAQETTGRGFRQAEQALLGRPVEAFSTVEIPFEEDPFRSAITALQPLGTPGSIGGPSTGAELLPQGFLENRGGQAGLLSLRELGLTDEQIVQQARLGNVAGIDPNQAARLGQNPTVDTTVPGGGITGGITSGGFLSGI